MITERDEEFVAAMDATGGLDLPSLQLMFGLPRTQAYRRMARLEQYGMVEAARPFLRCAAIYIPTKRGMREILGREDLYPPSVSAGSYTHQLQVARCIAELDHHGVRWQASRTTRRDQKAATLAGDSAEADRYSITLSWLEQNHLPDILMWPSETAEATEQPIAIEVELAQKSARRLDEILLGYAVALDMAGVLYVCGPHSIHAVRRAAADLDDRAHIAEVTSIYEFGPHFREPRNLGGRPTSRKVATETEPNKSKRPFTPAETRAAFTPVPAEETWIARNLTAGSITAVERRMRGADALTLDTTL